MASGLYLQSKFHDNEKSDDAIGLDLNVSTYVFPRLPKLENSSSACYTPCSDKTRTHKRLRLWQIGSAESINNSVCSDNSTLFSRSANSLNSLPGLHFRDHIWAYKQRYLAVEAMNEAAKALVNDEGDDHVKEEVTGDGVRLVQLLLACAEAVACRDKSHASALLSELRSEALVFGTSFQRVASCFVQGLSDRLALVHLLRGIVPAATPPKNMAISLEKEEALSLVYDICPQIQFGHFIANAAILEALEGESSVHIVDLGMTLCLRDGHQWRRLMHRLVNRAGQPPRRVRITGVGSCGEHLRAIGDELERYARTLDLNFEFSVVESNLENLQAKEFGVRGSEVLVINSILQLHCVVKESRGALNSVLQTMHELNPKALVLVEQDSSHNGPFFLGRFMEALHYYAAIFDSLDAMLPRYDTRRVKMEQFFFAEEIKNIVSCEGPARVERHERLDQWRRRMSRAGFQPSPIKMLSQAKQWLGEINFCEGYTVVEEKGCLVLGWKSKPIVAASCWKCF
ncbi:unnamed protein product [Camellia sinensis]